MSWSDDPERDFARWDAYQARQYEKYIAACVRCELCHRPIDPVLDSACYELGDEHFHISCFNSAVEKSNIPENIKEYIKECVEAEGYKSTPIPEV